VANAGIHLSNDHGSCRGRRDGCRRDVDIAREILVDILVWSFRSLSPFLCGWHATGSRAPKIIPKMSILSNDRMTAGALLPSIFAVRQLETVTSQFSTMKFSAISIVTVVTFAKPATAQTPCLMECPPGRYGTGMYVLLKRGNSTPTASWSLIRQWCYISFLSQRIFCAVFWGFP
jgi:hypothetical protein